MSDRDKPVNPFGRGERTIIRPNPGGRLPQAPVPNPSGEQQPSAPGARAPFSPNPLADNPAYQPVPPPVAPVATPPPPFAAAQTQ